MNQDSSAPLLQKLCELQQRQLDKLTELSTHLSEIAAENRKTSDGYYRQIDAYKQSLDIYQKSDTRRSKEAMWRGIIIASMLGLVAVSIIVSRFL
ncbi:MAG: hypothetical protein JWL90_3701 [Chthoniobacteraceae bacterium]|nr:hypothetical protein [Chthoniobacteraceae bacterium]MDB6170814.1 hypothetical protein [Chthoniobacteraceae bacterium]